MPHQDQVLMPSQVSEDVGWFDRMARNATALVSRATFFSFCVLLVLVWAPSILLIGNVDTWQLIINTATTIITFLMVALLQNSNLRGDQAVQHKLNAIADGLADVMTHLAQEESRRHLSHDEDELREAVGLEERESTTHNARDESS